MLSMEPVHEPPTLPEHYTWRILFSNLGNAPFRVTRVGFEDPITGQLTCQSGDLELKKCPNFPTIKPQQSEHIEITLRADYSTSAYHKTLVFESASHVQRVPISVTTDAKVLEFAAHFAR